MKHGWILSLFLGLAAAPHVQAQGTPWQFRWQKGQVLTYKVEHKTQVAELAEGSKVESSSRLNLVKRWQVVDVDAQGIATLHLSLTAMRNEQKRPDGETILFDSADLQKSTPELREQMSKFLGKTLTILRIDSQGRVHEVKQGSATKYEMEPPFQLVLPAAAPQANQAWLRPFNITLEPPLGTGEKYPAAQKYQVQKVEGGKATLAMTTEIKTMPTAPAEQAPLAQRQLQGQLIFDVTAGRLHGAALNIDRTVENHQGPGSSYRFVSSYSEQIVE